MKLLNNPPFNDLIEEIEEEITEEEITEEEITEDETEDKTE